LQAIKELQPANCNEQIVFKSTNRSQNMQPTNQLRTKKQLQPVNLQNLPNCRIAINQPTSSKKIKENLLTATNQHIATIEPFATDQLQPI